MSARLPKHIEQLRWLAIGHFVYSGLALMGLLILFVQYLMVQQISAGVEAAEGGFHDEALQLDSNIPEMMSGFFVLFGLMMVGMFVANIASGICLRQVKGRTLSLVVAVLNCLQFPLGTALGGLTLFALFQDPVREAYGGDAGLGLTKQ